MRADEDAVVDVYCPDCKRYVPVVDGLPAATLWHHRREGHPPGGPR